MPWLENELAVVKPAVLVCLGATAAQALLGRQFRVSLERGKVMLRQQTSCGSPPGHGSLDR